MITNKLPIAMATKIPITHSSITITGTEFTYSGTEYNVRDTLVIKYYDRVLVEDTDYIIQGTTTATNAGSYSFIVTGIGGFAGSKTITWIVNRKTINDSDAIFKVWVNGSVVSQSLHERGTVGPYVYNLPRDSALQIKVARGYDELSYYEPNRAGEIIRYKTNATFASSSAPSVGNEYVMVTVSGQSRAQQSWTYQDTFTFGATGYAYVSYKLHWHTANYEGDFYTTFYPQNNS